MHKRIVLSIVPILLVTSAILISLSLSYCKPDKNLEFTHKMNIDGNVPSAVFSAYQAGSVKDSKSADANGNVILSFTDNKEYALVDSITGKAIGYVPVKFTGQSVGKSKDYTVNFENPVFMHNIAIDGNVPSAVFSAYKGGAVKDSKAADGNGDANLVFSDNEENAPLDSIVGIVSGYVKFKVENQTIGLNKAYTVVFEKAKRPLIWTLNTSENISTVAMNIYNTKGDKIYSGNVPLSGNIADITSLGSLTDPSWKMVLASPATLTDTLNLLLSGNLNVVYTLEPRPTISGRAVKLLENKYEYGGLKPVNERVGVPDLGVAIGSNNFGKTDASGNFSFRPDFVGNARVDIIDMSDVYYSKWFNILLEAGKVLNVKDFKSDQIDMIAQYTDPLGNDLLERMWLIMDFKYSTAANSMEVSIPDSILLKRGKVWIDPVFDGKNYNNCLSDIIEWMNNCHFKGVPKLSRGDTLKTMFYIHYGGTLNDGMTRWTTKKNAEGLPYVDRVDIYFRDLWCNYNTKGYIYALNVHEGLRAFGASTEFPEKNYVMYIDPISRVFRDGFSPEPTPLEQKIWDNYMSFTGHPVIFNNKKKDKELNFPKI